MYHPITELVAILSKKQFSASLWTDTLQMLKNQSASCWTPCTVDAAKSRDIRRSRVDLELPRVKTTSVFLDFATKEEVPHTKTLEINT
jgi:hypothetical protein